MNDIIIGRFHHAHLQVTNIERGIRFLRNNLGVTEVGRVFYENGSVAAVYVKAGSAYIEVSPVETPVPQPAICFEVEDIRKIFETLKKNGVCIDQDITPTKSKCLQMYIKDDDGNRFELFQILTESFLFQQ